MRTFHSKTHSQFLVYVFIACICFLLTACGNQEIPDPILELTGTREGDGGLYLEFSITNFREFPDNLFSKFDDEFLCGRMNVEGVYSDNLERDNLLNRRTWIEFYDADSNSLIKAITRRTFLNYILVHVNKGDVIPNRIYLLLRDRKDGREFRSNIISLEQISTDDFIVPSSEWESVYSMPGGIPLQSIVFVNGNEGWAGGGQNSNTVGIAPDILLHTTDNGDTWKMLPIQCGEGIYDIEFSNSLSGTAISGNGVYGTNDGGLNWNRITNEEMFSGLRAGKFLDDNTLYITGLYDHFSYSTDSGITWQDASPDLADYNAMYYEDMEFLNRSTGWISGVWPSNKFKGIILHTTDGGTSWTLQHEDFAGDIRIDFVNENDGWAIAWNGVILRTEDSGNSWTVQYQDPEITLSSIFFEDALRGWVGGHHGILLHTTDGGVTWSMDHLPIYGGWIESIYVNGDYIFVIDFNGNILRKMVDK